MTLDFYPIQEMTEILRRSAQLLGVDLNREQLDVVAARSRGTPRIGNRLMSRVRDYVLVKGKTDSAQIVREALEFLDVDEKGLQPLDRKYLSVLLKAFGGGPAGVEALAASLAEDRSTLEETVEPFLLKIGMILRTPRGRVATEDAYRHLGLLAGPQNNSIFPEAT